MRKRAEEQAQKELKRKKEKRKRDLKAAEDARLRELRKKAEEEREAHFQRLQMQQQFELDKKLQQEKARAEKEQKKRARAEEQMRAKKHELHEIQTRKILEKQRREIEQKMMERTAKGEFCSWLFSPRYVSLIFYYFLYYPCRKGKGRKTGTQTFGRCTSGRSKTKGGRR
jgi:hypothetical protein